MNSNRSVDSFAAACAVGAALALAGCAGAPPAPVRLGLKLAPATLAGVRQMIRALRKGGTIGLLPDQVPPEGMGVWAPFFGREAYTMTLAARLHARTVASVGATSHAPHLTAGAPSETMTCSTPFSSISLSPSSKVCSWRRANSGQLGRRLLK